jgi:hypothetical protein
VEQKMPGAVKIGGRGEEGGRQGGREGGKRKRQPLVEKRVIMREKGSQSGKPSRSFRSKCKKKSRRCFPYLVRQECL